MQETEIVIVDLCWGLIYKNMLLCIKTKPHDQQIYEDLSFMKKEVNPYSATIAIDQIIQDHKRCSEINDVLKELVTKKLSL